MSEKNAPKTVATTRKGNVEEPANVEDDSYVQDGDINVEDEPEQSGATGRRPAKAAKEEVSKRVTGAVNATTDVLKLSSGALGQMLGNFVRELLTKNTARMVEFMAGLVSGLGDCLQANGVLNAVRGAAVKNIADLGKTSTQLAGAVLASPIKAANDGLNKLAKRGAAALPAVTKTLSNGVRGALSFAGVDSGEDDVENQQRKSVDDGDDEEDEDVPPPPPAPAKRNTRKPVFRTTK